MSVFRGCTVVAGLSGVLGLLGCGAAYAEGVPPPEIPIKETTAKETTVKEAPVNEATDKKPVAGIIPITASDWRAHKSLYREGWRVVSSSEKALSYAKEHSITSSGQAIAQAVEDAGKHSAEYGKGLKESAKGGVQTGTAVFTGGTRITEGVAAVTAGLVKTEWDYGSSNLHLAWERFVKGNLTLTQRTAEDWQALQAVPWYKGLNAEFSNLNALTDAAVNDMSPHIQGDWNKAFAEARADFDESYRQSGTRGNALSGLGDILGGYVKVLYSGLVKPASRSAAQGVEGTAGAAAKVVFLPVAGAFIVTGRTVESAGLSVYYTTSMGVKLVSPTVEGGLLTGLAMLSYGSIAPTAVAGGATGAVNEIAVAAAAPVVGAGQAAATGAANTAMYAAQVSYDLAKGVTMVTMNQAQTAVVLGYNGITAIPAQIGLAGIDGAVFLFYDGPRLAVAAANGEVQWSSNNGEKGKAPLQSLPVGSVVDLNALRKEPGVQVKVISEDPEVVQKVLEKLPDDLREGKQP